MGIFKNICMFCYDIVHYASVPFTAPFKSNKGKNNTKKINAVVNQNTVKELKKEDYSNIASWDDIIAAKIDKGDKKTEDTFENDYYGNYLKTLTPREKKIEDNKRKQLLKKMQKDEERQIKAEKQLIEKINFENDKKDKKEVKEINNTDIELESDNKVKKQVKTAAESLREIYYKTSFGKNALRKKAVEKQLLKSSLNEDIEVRSKVKLPYEYEARDKTGKITTGVFEGYSKVDIINFLAAEGYTVYSLKTSPWLQMVHNFKGKSHGKMKNKDLIFFLAQLSTYLKAGMPLVEAIKILNKQMGKSRKYKRIFRAIIYDLTTGKSFSEALEVQKGSFPPILVNMIKTSEMTGELPEVLDDMEEYFEETEATRKATITALIYPSIIFVMAIGVGTFMMIYIVPKFTEIYSTMDTELPSITKFMLWFSDFLSNYFILILLAVILIIFFVMFLFKNVQPFRLAVQTMLMKLPGLGSVFIYNEVNMFAKTFASLLAHNVFITDSMAILNKITNNEIYKGLIRDTLKNVSKGGKVSTAFKDHWAFPVPAYEMIVTGEKTGQLDVMMDKVAAYYQDLHKNSVTRIKTFIEPFMIILMTAIVGTIVLSVVIPMFDMYDSISG